MAWLVELFAPLLVIWDWLRIVSLLVSDLLHALYFSYSLLFHSVSHPVATTPADAVPLMASLSKDKSNVSGQKSNSDVAVVTADDKHVKKHTVVIVGGSFAGISAAMQLGIDPSFRVILIEQKGYFEYTPGILHAMVDPQHYPGLVADLQLPNVHILRGVAGNISPSTVTVTFHARPHPPGRSVPEVHSPLPPPSPSQQLVVPYDYLILAHGSYYYSPIKAAPCDYTLNARLASVARFASEVPNFTTVTIVGAGLVGVELAAEICTYHPHLRITLHSAMPTIMPGFDKSVIDYAMAFFARNNVEVKCNSEFRLQGYVPAEGELYLPCVGITPTPITINPSLVARAAEKLEDMEARGEKPLVLPCAVPPVKVSQRNQPPTGASSTSGAEAGTGAESKLKPAILVERLDKDTPISTAASSAALPNPDHGALVAAGLVFGNGRIPVEATLQTRTAPHIFAVGDANMHAANMPKMAFVAEADGRGVARAVMRLAKGGKPELYPLSVFYGCRAPDICCISLGPYDGIMIFNGLYLYGKVAAFGKLFIELTKVAAVRQNALSQLLWEIADPMAAAVNAAMIAVQRRVRTTLAKAASASFICIAGALSTMYIFG